MGEKFAHKAAIGTHPVIIEMISCLFVIVEGNLGDEVAASHRKIADQLPARVHNSAQKFVEGYF